MYESRPWSACVSSVTTYQRLLILKSNYKQVRSPAGLLISTWCNWIIWHFLSGSVSALTRTDSDAAASILLCYEYYCRSLNLCAYSEECTVPLVVKFGRCPHQAITVAHVACALKIVAVRGRKTFSSDGPWRPRTMHLDWMPMRPRSGCEVNFSVAAPAFECRGINRADAATARASHTKGREAGLCIIADLRCPNLSLSLQGSPNKGERSIGRRRERRRS